MKHLTLIFLIILSFTSICRSETHISGNVSGIWGPEGNPYIADSTVVVPAGQELQILPGVEISFSPEQYFIINGKLTAIGTVTDSIRIHWSNDNEEDNGSINLIGSDTCKFRYCQIDTPEYSFDAWETKLIVENCSIRHWREMRVLGPAYFSISYCDIWAHIKPIECVTAVTAYIHDNIINADICGAGIHGISFDNYSYGEIINNVCNGYIGDFYFSTGIIVGNIMTKCEILLNFGNVLVEDNQIFDPILNVINEGQLNLMFLATAVTAINNSMTHLNISGFNPGADVWVEGNTITDGVLIEGAPGTLLLKENLILDGVEIDWNSPWAVDIIGNTIYMTEGNFGINSVDGILGDVRNNIIHGLGYDGFGIKSNGAGIVVYNCIDGFAIPIYNVQSASSNIFIDPQLAEGLPLDFSLQPNSPCIDAGDPNSLLDPDSTRKDIGVYYFDHNIDHPPIVSCNPETLATRNYPFTYTVTATDDNGPINLEVEQLPNWFTQQDFFDWVSDSLVLSGIVPVGQQDFSFFIRASDGLNQIDTQWVNVEISGYLPIHGETSGTLTAADSPYLIVSEVVVPYGATLTIEPGVEIRARECPFLYPYPYSIIVNGSLIADGTDEDSIHFNIEYPDSDYYWGGIKLINCNEDSSIISRCIIQRAEIYSDSSQAFIISNNTLKNSFSGITMENHSGGKVFSNHIYDMESYGIAVYSSITEFYSNILDDTLFSSLNIKLDSSDCYFYNNDISGNQGIHVGFNSNPMIFNNIIHDITFDGITVNNGSAPVIYNNTICNCQNGIFLTMTIAEIKNNIITENSLFGIKQVWIGTPTDTCDIEYNNVWHNDIGNYVGGVINYGNLITTNANGDSCDIYNNISLNPQFVGGEPFDYSLAFGSPCIDAGTDVGFPYYGAAPDIGAYESNYSGVGKNDLTAYRFELYQNYPNPFNQSTRINYTIAKDSRVKILVYNILGEQVQVLQDGILSSGHHSILLQAESFSSGIYFIKMECPSENFVQLRKAVILK